MKDDRYIQIPRKELDALFFDLQEIWKVFAPVPRKLLIENFMIKVERILIKYGAKVDIQDTQPRNLMEHL